MSSRSVSLRWLLGGAALLELTILYLVLKNNSWVYDDNFILVLAGQEGFSWHWLMSPVYQHWDIAMNAAYSLQHALFFFDYRWALVAMLGFLGGSMLLLQRVLALLIRSKWVAVLIVLWFGLNIIWIRPLQWWAGGVQYFPYTFFDLLCLYGFLRFHASRSPRWVFLSAGALAGGLLFYEKPAFMLVYLGLFRVLLMAPDLRPRVLLTELLRERVLWLSYLAVVVVWGAAYVHSHAYGGSSLGAVTGSEYLTYFRILWLQTLAPSLVSLTIPASHLDMWQVLMVVSCQAAVLVGILISLRKTRSAWRAWVFLAIVILASGGLVARSRVAQFGVDIANDPRYLIDFTWLVPLALCAAFAKEGVLSPRMTDDGRLARPSSPMIPFLACLILVAYGGVSVASAEHLQKSWPGEQSRRWERHLRHSLALFQKAHPHFVVADNETPFIIMEPFVAPYNRLSRVLNMYVGAAQVDGPLNGPLITVAEDGFAHRANIIPLGSTSAIRDLVRSGQVGVSEGRLVRYGNELCVIADAVPAKVERRLQARPSTGSAPYYIRVGYRVWRPIAVPVFVNSGPGYPAVTDHSIELRPDAGVSIAWLGPAAPQSVLLTIPPRTTMCLARFDVVTLRDAS